MPDKLPKGWTWARFDDVFQVASDAGRRLPQGEYAAMGKYPVIDQGEKDPGGFTDEDLVYEGDLPVILFGDHTRRFKLIERPFVVGAQGVKILRPAREVPVRFLWLAVNGLKIESRGYSRHFQFLKKARIPLAPLPEQERMVAKLDVLLSRVAAGEAAARRALERLKRYRAAVLHAAVTGELTRAWRKKHSTLNPQLETGAKLLQRLLQERRSRWEAAELKRLQAAGKPPNDDKWKEQYPKSIGADKSKLPKLPEGWTWISLNQLAIHLTSGSRDWSKYYGKGSGTFLMAQNVRRSGLDLTFRQAVDPPDNDRDRERSQVNKDDILVTIVGANTGDVCVVPKELPEHFVCQSVAMLRLAVPSVSQFVWLYLSSDEDGQKQWRRMIYGAGRPHLSFEHLRMTAVPVPPEQEQMEIVGEVERRLAAVSRLTDAIKRQLDRTRVLRQSLLRDAFTGQLVLQNPNDEPVSALLDRIRAAREAKLKNKPSPVRRKLELVH